MQRGNRRDAVEQRHNKGTDQRTTIVAQPAQHHHHPDIQRQRHGVIVAADKARVNDKEHTADRSQRRTDDHHLATTWNNYGGYPEAWQAPPAIQDRRALDDINRILTRFGSVDYVPVAWYVGDGGANNVRTGEWPLSYLPNPAYNTITIGDYQTKWLDHYRTIALPAAGVTPTPCPTGMAAIIAWAETQLGNPYAAIDPWRFGTPTWPGGTRTGARGDIYTFPAGTTVYDCSGFVIAAYRQIGVDFVAQYGITGSQLFITSRIPDADRTALQPGDIAVYEPVDGVGHVVLIHHIEPNGTVRTIEASPSYGVHIGTLRWQRVTALKRPATP